jgi:hypothetical protein
MSGDIRAPAPSPPPSDSVIAEMRALRARIKPDPEGWTTRDYVQHCRVNCFGRQCQYFNMRPSANAFFDLEYARPG